MLGDVAMDAPSGVDATTLATLEFADGLLAQISCTFATARHRHAFIAGDAGIDRDDLLQRHRRGVSAAARRQARHRLGCARAKSIETAATSGFLAEAESFHDLVRCGWSHWTGATPDESIDIARTLDALAASARRGVPVTIDD